MKESNTNAGIVTNNLLIGTISQCTKEKSILLVIVQLKKKVEETVKNTAPYGPQHPRKVEIDNAQTNPSNQANDLFSFNFGEAQEQ